MPKLTTRSKPRIPTRREDLYGGGFTGNLLHMDYVMRQDVYSWFQKVHHSGGKAVVDRDGYYTRNGHRWKVPLGVREALRTPLVHGQMVHKYPWFVTWVSPKTGRRLKKHFMSLPRAVEFMAEKVQYVDPSGTICSRHGQMIPTKLRNKLPPPWKWCPCCMKARKFYRVYPENTFYAMIRDPQSWEMKERKLPLLHCRVCGTTNRDAKYRRSNQHWITRRFKRGVRRARRVKRG